MFDEFTRFCSESFHVGFWGVVIVIGLMTVMVVVVFVVLYACFITLEYVGVKENKFPGKMTGCRYIEKAGVYELTVCVPAAGSEGITEISHLTYRRIPDNHLVQVVYKIGRITHNLHILDVHAG